MTANIQGPGSPEFVDRPQETTAPPVGKTVLPGLGDTIETAEGKVWQPQSYSGTPTLPPPFGPRKETFDNTLDHKLLTQEYEETYAAVLEEYAENHKPPLTKKQIEQLRYAHLHPKDTSIPINFRTINWQLEQIAILSVREKNDLPGTWFPGEIPPEGEFPPAQYLSYEELLTSLPEDIRIALEKNNLKPEGKRDSFLTAVDGHLKLIAEGFGFLGVTPLNFGIDPTSLVRVKLGEELPRLFLNNLLDNTDEIVNELKLNVDSLGLTGEERVVYLDFLKKITDIITALKQFLYEMQASDSEVSKKETLAKKDALLLQLDKLLEQLEKTKKQRFWNKLLKILGPVLIALSVLATILSAGTLSWTAIAVTVAMTAITVADSVTGFIGKGINGIAKALAPDSELAQALIAILVTVLVAILAKKVVSSSFLAKRLGTETAKVLGTQVALQLGIATAASTGAVQLFFSEILKAAGVDEDTAEIVGAVLAFIVLLLAILVGTKAAMKGIQNYTRENAARLEKIQENLRLIIGTLEVGVAGTQAYVHIQQLILTLQKGDLDAFIDEIRALIQLLDKVIKSLQEDLEKNMEFVVTLSEAHEKIVTDHSRLATTISQAA